MTFASLISDSSSTSQSWSLAFGLSKSRFQSIQFLVMEVRSDALSSSLSARWWLILFIRGTFNSWIRPPGKTSADNVGGNSDLSDKLDAAARSCCKFDQDALMISSVSEIYPTAVICSFWVRDSVCVASRFWLPWHISKKSWTLAILCNFIASTSFFNSKSKSVSVVSDPG